ncbi:MULTISPECIES: aminoglycoside phosphotransferase family protein [unclassified Nocardioides]|uniref:aminoglycoside phosphotransferase family protein n=1 Tax=unclassified Nocardioides TaxID=2615069 RepID=UPI0009F0714F|nr:MULTISPECIES: aminoglycoside phosphotransferase family protein [unclassified Nocardioides]GAW49977.1 aminoglycoside/hydroxyurea antibiotic resistance kinase [Nocardioides sp. PD653-B2]GAW55930.1 aminoglycoside/hydroxyurea antibiotic resistance kinase [Nocardioides sp. PD653]
MSVPIPATFARYAARGPAWADFLDRLPRLLGDLVADWQLTVDGEPAHGHAALVVPVRTRSGRPAALKVGYRHEEAEHESLALQHWHGRGAVQLLRADPHRSALLLERLHAEDLGDLWDVEACEIVAGLYGQLHVPAPPQLRLLPSYAERWARELDALPRDAPLPRRLVEQAAALARDLSRDEASSGRMIHTDLHYANVLAGDRVPWLVIDPKPLNGDPHYEVAPMLWNRWEEIGSARSVRDGVRRRFHTVVDAAGFDERRARDWVVVRMLVNALWRLQDPPGTRRLTADNDHVTRCVAVAKAVQD